MPVFGTMASRFNDDGVTALYQALLPRLAALGLKPRRRPAAQGGTRHSTHQVPIVPGARVRYLADIADTVRGYKRRAREQAALAREIQQLRAAARMLQVGKPDKPRAAEAASSWPSSARRGSTRRRRSCWRCGPTCSKAYAGDEYVVKIRDREIRTALTHTTLSGSKIRKVALPQYECHGETAEVAAARQRARQLPLHRRHLRLQARERGPDAHVRRRGRRLPHQPALQAAERRHAGQAAEHRLRQRHAVRQRPRPAARHLRQGRQLAASASPRSTT
jgi:hypothetical protein